MFDITNKCNFDCTICQYDTECEEYWQEMCDKQSSQEIGEELI